MAARGPGRHCAATMTGSEILRRLHVVSGGVRRPTLTPRARTQTRNFGLGSHTRKLRSGRRPRDKGRAGAAVQPACRRPDGPGDQSQAKMRSVQARFLLGRPGPARAYRDPGSAAAATQ